MESVLQWLALLWVIFLDKKMSETNGINLSDVKDLNEREIILLLVDRVNGLAKKIEAFFEVTKNHITRQEYDKFESRVNADITDIQKRLGNVTNDVENGKLKKTTLFSFGSDTGRVLLWIATMAQFFYIIATSKS